MKLAFIGTGKIIGDALFAAAPVESIEITAIFARPHSRGKAEAFAGEYKRLLRTLPSYYDLKEENSYHMMMLGMCTFLTGDYDVESNRESGMGRSDIILRAKTEGKPNIIMEFKYTRNENKDLRELAGEALEQIERKDYAAGLQGEVVCIGLGHRGKEAKVSGKAG